MPFTSITTATFDMKKPIKEKKVEVYLFIFL